MAYDLEEQEQIATMKAFWEKYGNFILTVITVVLLAVAAYRGWGWYQARQSAQASAVYGQLGVSVERKDVARVRGFGGHHLRKYGSTAYGQMAALLAAKAYTDAGDLKSAKAPLQWAVENAPTRRSRTSRGSGSPGSCSTRRLTTKRLAAAGGRSSGPLRRRVRRPQGRPAGRAGQADEARAAYKLALEKLDERSSVRRLVQLKADALGGADS